MGKGFGFLEGHHPYPTPQGDDIFQESMFSPSISIVPVILADGIKSFILFRHLRTALSAARRTNKGCHAFLRPISNRDIFQHPCIPKRSRPTVFICTSKRSLLILLPPRSSPQALILQRPRSRSVPSTNPISTSHGSVLYRSCCLKRMP